MMKLCFMTFSCPDWGLNEVLTAAIKYGYEAVEPRSEANHQHGLELETTKKERKQIKASFEDTAIECACIATSRNYAMAQEADRKESIERTKRYIDLAHDLGCEHLRVFGGQTPDELEFEDAKKHVAESLAACAEHAGQAGVYLCLETHDAYSRSADAAEVVKMADHANVAINWDIMHPFRLGESIAESFENVKDHVRHCHVHDGTAPVDGGSGGWELAPMGQGDIPHDEAFDLLAGIGYEGALSGEWINWDPADEALPREA
ncbi:MAG: sugar phosphate isomerase/epimerase family protein, partial [Candidatus Hydrogenedentes bacterium]|nr:sugar phosphate isomerase/epimerase family protein [Candidatus Hydrogenedentota bacterium]